MRGSHIRPNILSVSMRVFMDEINIEIDRVKQIALSNVGGPDPIN